MSTCNPPSSSSMIQSTATFGLAPGFRRTQSLSQPKPSPMPTVRRSSLPWKCLTAPTRASMYGNLKVDPERTSDTQLITSWMKKRSQYQRLWQIAMDLLSIPSMSAENERVFSVAKLCMTSQDTDKMRKSWQHCSVCNITGPEKELYWRVLKWKIRIRITDFLS